MSTVLAEKLTSRKLIVKNISLNFLIQGITFVVGIVTIPTIIRGIGVDRFGILTIIWSIIGYSCLFDLGLGRALTQVVSSKLGEGKEDEVPSVIWTSLILIFVLGILAAVAVYALAPVLVNFIKVPQQFHQETLQSLQLLSLSLPFLIFVFGFKGVLESYQKFDYTNWLRIPILISNYVIPIFLLHYYQSLTALVLVLALGRILTCFGYFWAVAKTVDNFFGHIRVSKEHFISLFRFGGWLTVSSIINPFMSYLDRFLISGLLTSQVVAYYATPYDVLSKLSIVSAAVMSVIFPALTTEFARRTGRARQLYNKTLASLALILLVPVLVAIFLAKPLITVWIGANFAEQSFQLAQLLALYFFVSCLNTVPYSVIQSLGRSDVTAKINLVEFPIYLAALFICVKQMGIIGAPIGALVRIILDSILMHFFALRYVKQSEQIASEHCATQ